MITTKDRPAAEVDEEPTDKRPDLTDALVPLSASGDDDDVWAYLEQLGGLEDEVGPAMGVSS